VCSSMWHTLKVWAICSLSVMSIFLQKLLYFNSMAPFFITISGKKISQKLLTPANFAFISQFRFEQQVKSYWIGFFSGRSNEREDDLLKFFFRHKRCEAGDRWPRRFFGPRSPNRAQNNWNNNSQVSPSTIRHPTEKRRILGEPVWPDESAKKITQNVGQPIFLSKFAHNFYRE
jgi:hypothetical protein